MEANSALESITMNFLPWKIFFTTAVAFLASNGVAGFNISTETNSTGLEGNTTAVNEDREYVLRKLYFVKCRKIHQCTVPRTFACVRYL